MESNEDPRLKISQMTQVFLTTKKTFYYNFFPTKEEEDSYKRQGVWPDLSKNHCLVEIRDIYPPPVLNPQKMLKIKKIISQYDILNGEIIISFNDWFEHVLRYWNMHSAKLLVEGQKRVIVPLWNEPVIGTPKKYENTVVFMNKNDDFVISCLELMRDRNLKVGDEMFLYWDDDSGFHVKLLLGT